MTRPITKRFLVRTLNRVARIAYNLECNEKFAASLVKSGLKSKRFRYLGSYLSNLAYLMQRFEPVTSESRCMRQNIHRTDRSPSVRNPPLLLEQLQAKRPPQTPRTRPIR
jgi:hypothetical protein